jgi:hypothetical protein
MKKLFAVLALMALLGSFPSFAANADENPVPVADREKVLTRPWDSQLDPGKFWITYGVQGGTAIMPSPVFLKNMTKEIFCQTNINNCVSPGDNLLAGGYATYCAQKKQLPCVEKVEFRTKGETSWVEGNFVNYWDATPSSETVNQFRQNTQNWSTIAGIKDISTVKGWADNPSLKLMGSAPGPLMFDAPGFESKTGTTKYMVLPYFAQFLSDFHRGKFNSITYDTFYVNVLPIIEVQSVDARASIEFLGISPKGKTLHMGSGVGLHKDNFYSVDGRYAYATGFDSSLELQVTMQMPSEVGGWFHSRLTNPDLKLSNISPGVSRLVLAGASADIPITYTAVEAFDPANKKYLEYTFGKDNEDMEQRRKSGAGGRAGGFWDPNNGTESFKFWFSKLDEAAKGKITVWSVARMPLQRLGDNPCLNRTDRIQGLINTNAMVYQSLVPEYKNGFLNYEVMGVHRDLNNEVMLGEYDLIMRSDAARCLYKFSSAPVSGTITVIDANGSPQIATTTLGEKAGWLRLSAKNFTFSNKIVRVKLTQPRGITITCMSTAKPVTTRKVTGVSPKCPQGFRKR